ISSLSRLWATSSGVSNSKSAPVRKTLGPLREYLPTLRRASVHMSHKHPTRGVQSAPPVPRNTRVGSVDLFESKLSVPVRERLIHVTVLSHKIPFTNQIASPITDEMEILKDFLL